MNQSKTVLKYAGEGLDKAARRRMEQKGVTAKYGTPEWSKAYSVALNEAMQANPRTTEAYNLGRRVVDEKVYATQSPRQREMDRCQNDPDWVIKRAGEVVGSAAMAIAQSGTGVLGQPGIASEERVRRATNLLLDRFPSLERAYTDGYISGTDWALLGLLVPSVAAECERQEGQPPINLRAGFYARNHVAGAHTYASIHRT